MLASAEYQSQTIMKEVLVGFPSRALVWLSGVVALEAGTRTETCMHSLRTGQQQHLHRPISQTLRQGELPGSTDNRGTNDWEAKA